MDALSARCPFCRTKLPDDEGHSRLVVVRCPGCKRLVDVPGRSTALEPREKYAPPPRFQVHDRQHEGLEVSWRWDRKGWGLAGSLMTIPMTLFAAFLAASDGIVGWVGLSPFLALTSSMAYASLVQMLNRTRVEVTRASVKISHGPLPWPGKVDLPRNEIAKLCVTWPTGTFLSRAIGSSLVAIRPHGERQRLFTSMQRGLSDADVLWLEQELKRHLGMED